MRHPGVQGVVQDEVQPEEAHEGAQVKESVSMSTVQQRILPSIILDRAHVHAHPRETFRLRHQWVLGKIQAARQA